VLDSALAEYAALRSELDEIARGQRQLLTLNVTTMAALYGFVLSQAISARLLLIAPFISAALGLLYQQYTLHAKGVGAYIDRHLRPLIVEYAGDGRLWGWHDFLSHEMYQTISSRVAMRLSFVLLVPAVPAFALVWVLRYLDSPWLWATWAVGLVVLAVQVASWLREARDVEWI
jgi:hypothetical protein